MTEAELIEQFRAAGIERGDSILVHSSLSSLGWVYGGADAVVGALIGAVEDEGTVLFPTLTGSSRDSVSNPPVFDCLASKCWTGAIPETARQYSRSVRSLHPTHSVAAVGKLAGWFASGHELARTPCGFGSPYDKLADIGGKIVLIGVSQDTNTSFHMAEEIAEVPYVIHDEPVDCQMTDSTGRSFVMRTHLHKWGARRNYSALEPEMIDLGICQIRTVGNAEVRIDDAMLQRMFLVRRLLDDPLAVLEASERVNWLQSP